MAPLQVTAGGGLRSLYHPWTPAVVLLAVAVAATAATLSGERPPAVLWWMVIGLVSGYAISGSV
jgi:hypothetical protein